MRRGEGQLGRCDAHPHSAMPVSASACNSRTLLVDGLNAHGLRIGCSSPVAVLSNFTHYYGKPGDLSSVLDVTQTCLLCGITQFQYNIPGSHKRGQQWNLCHIRMRAQGGGAEVDNLMPGCASCNQRAPHLPMLEFIARTMPWRLLIVLAKIRQLNPPLHAFTDVRAMVDAKYLPEGGVWSQPLLDLIAGERYDVIVAPPAAAAAAVARNAAPAPAPAAAAAAKRKDPDNHPDEPAAKR